MAKLYLVGLGPGSLDLMSVRSQQVIQNVDIVVGYGPYVKLIESLIHSQTLVRTGMTKEWQSRFGNQTRTRRKERRFSLFW
nr:SAM-dependent methyltransferase [Vibrio sonorensis]